MKNRLRTSTTALLGALILSVLSTAQLAAQHTPPASPPAEWGPLSINLEEIRLSVSGALS